MSICGNLYGQIGLDRLSHLGGPHISILTTRNVDSTFLSRSPISLEASTIFVDILGKVPLSHIFLSV